MRGFGMLLVAAATIFGNVQAAEVRGRVEFGAGRSGPASVALLPLEGQRTAPSPPQERTLHLRNGQFDPPYAVARVGDRLRVVNEDQVFHVLVAPYAPQPFQATLTRSGSSGAEADTVLHSAGTWYLFCRIHPRTYARIDVLETPLLQLTNAGGRFEFQGIPAGRWQLRVAARGGESVYRELTAFTAPPPVVVTLPGRAPAPGSAEAARVEALFPERESTP